MTVSKESSPDLWLSSFPVPDANSHKYTRGTALIRGGSLMTGASRLAARAAQRMGAGLVTIAAPSSALSIYAEALESVIVRPCDDNEVWRELVEDKRCPALLIGPGLGQSPEHKEEIQTVLRAKRPTVIDADALTIFGSNPDELLALLHSSCVLTPHEGEFVRLFGVMNDSRINCALRAAKHAQCVLLLKGAETIIALPDGSLIVNRNAPPWLATAGSGDVLAGIITGLLSQGMPAFNAAAAAVWVHGQIAQDHGIGLIAEDIVESIPATLKTLLPAFN